MKTLEQLIFIVLVFCYKNQVKNKVFFEGIPYLIFTLFSNKTTSVGLSA
jgi:hypothetical protein